jgi:hypothetical protein
LVTVDAPSQAATGGSAGPDRLLRPELERDPNPTEQPQRDSNPCSHLERDGPGVAQMCLGWSEHVYIGTKPPCAVLSADRLLTGRGLDHSIGGVEDSTCDLDAGCSCSRHKQQLDGSPIAKLAASPHGSGTMRGIRPSARTDLVLAVDRTARLLVRDVRQRDVSLVATTPVAHEPTLLPTIPTAFVRKDGERESR